MFSRSSSLTCQIKTFPPSCHQSSLQFPKPPGSLRSNSTNCPLCSSTKSSFCFFFENSHSMHFFQGLTRSLHCSFFSYLIPPPFGCKTVPLRLNKAPFSYLCFHAFMILVLLYHKKLPRALLPILPLTQYFYHNNPPFSELFGSHLALPRSFPSGCGYLMNVLEFGLPPLKFTYSPLLLCVEDSVSGLQRLL